jgi:hypothetical protein
MVTNLTLKQNKKKDEIFSHISGGEDIEKKTKKKTTFLRIFYVCQHIRRTICLKNTKPFFACTYIHMSTLKKKTGAIGWQVMAVGVCKKKNEQKWLKTVV